MRPAFGRQVQAAVVVASEALAESDPPRTRDNETAGGGGGGTGGIKLIRPLKTGALLRVGRAFAPRCRRGPWATRDSRAGTGWGLLNTPPPKGCVGTGMHNTYSPPAGTATHGPPPTATGCPWPLAGRPSSDLPVVSQRPSDVHRSGKDSTTPAESGGVLVYVIGVGLRSSQPQKKCIDI